MLNGEEVNPNSKGSVSPLQSLIGDENDPDNEVNYNEDDHDYLAAFEDGEQASIDQDGAPAMLDENNQSQDAHQTNQPLGIDQKHASQPVLTKQGVMGLVAKDAGILTPGSGWELTKQGYCGLLSGNESPNGSTVNVTIDLAALIIMSAVSETTIKNSLKMQQAANDKLLQQAE